MHIHFQRMLIATTILSMKNLVILTLFYASMTYTTSAHAETLAPFSNSLKPFRTDGCTMFVDGTPSKPALWRNCCVEHDIRYWFGGDQSDMDEADRRLRACVKGVAGTTWAKMIYLGVRTGHFSPVKNKTHWGWGWTLSRENSSLLLPEREYIIEEVRRLPYDFDFLENFIGRI